MLVTVNKTLLQDNPLVLYLGYWLFHRSTDLYDDHRIVEVVICIFHVTSFITFN